MFVEKFQKGGPTSLLLLQHTSQHTYTRAIVSTSIIRIHQPIKVSACEVLIQELSLT